jgi:hypothetical protein
MGRIADILQVRGQLDDALSIRKKEELPVYESLGDAHSRAVTMGKVAEILHARGQLDEALAIHSGRLPLAEAIGDIDSIAHIRFSSASIRLQRGGWGNGEAQTILNELEESFRTAQQIGRADFIGHIGEQFGRVLVLAGRQNEGVAVLEEAADAFETLQRSEDAAQVRALQDQIRGMGSAGPPSTKEGTEGVV